jgi:hypothetical protein
MECKMTNPGLSFSFKAFEQVNGGERGIRTPGTLTGTTDFESAAFDHSAISPRPTGKADFIRPG